MGDATNTVIILAGELLKKAEHLIIMGLHPSEIIKGYELALVKAISELESMSILKNVFIWLDFFPARPLNDISANAIHAVVLSYGFEACYRI
jgi:hypothetical protein